MNIRSSVTPEVSDAPMSWSKRRGTVEHGVHRCDAGGVPRADVLVKGRGIVEHPVHRRDAGGVPRANVLVEGRRCFVAIVLVCAK